MLNIVTKLKERIKKYTDTFSNVYKIIFLLFSIEKNINNIVDNQKALQSANAVINRSLFTFENHVKNATTLSKIALRYNLFHTKQQDIQRKEMKITVYMPCYAMANWSMQSVYEATAADDVR